MEQIVFQYKILSGDVLKSQTDLRKAIEATNKELQGGGKKSVAQQKALETQLKTLTRIYKGELNAGIRQSKKEFDASGAAGVDAYRKTAAQLAIVTRNIKNLRVENKAVPQALQKQFTTLRGQIDQADKSVGDFRRNVGNYSSSLKGLGGRLLTAFGFVGGINLLARTIKSSINLIKDFEQGNANLASILGKTKDQIGDLSDEAQRLGAVTAFSAPEVTKLQTELAKLGFSNEEIIKSTKSVIDFSIAVGTDAPKAAALLGSQLRAFNLDASEAGRVASVLAVATTKSALDFPKLQAALTKVAPVARAFNFSIEDTTALLGSLSDAGFEASIAGTSTRNILLNLADANGGLAKALGGSVSSFDELIPALIKLREDGVDLNETLELTDKRSVAAFNRFLEGAESAEALRDSITGVEAELSALVDTRLDTLSGQITLLSSAWQGLILSLDSGGGAFSSALSFLTDSATAVVTYISELNKGGLVGDQGFRLLFGDAKERASVIEDLEKQRRGIDGVARAGRGIRNVVKDKIKDDKKDVDTTKKKTEATKEQTKALEKLIKLQEEFNQAQINEEAEIYQSILKELSKELNILAKSSLTENIAIASKDAKTIEDTRTELEKINDAIRELKNNPPELAPQLDVLNSPSGPLENERDIFARLEQEKVEIAKLSAEERLKFEIQKLEKEKATQLEFGNDITAINQQLAQKDVELAQSTEQRKKQIRETALNGVFDVVNSIFSLQQDLDQQRFERQTTLLDEEYAARIEAAEGNSEEQEKLREELEEKRLIIAEEAFKKNKRNEIKQALISQAQAIIKAFGAGPIIGPILAAIIAIQTGIQIAKIKAQEFAKTGIIVPNQKSDQPIFTELGEGGSVPLGQFAKGKRHSQGGIKAIMNGRFVEYEQGEFVDKDEHGNIHVVNRRNSERYRDQLTSMAGQSFTGKGQALASINNHTSAGYIKAAEGQIIQSITETPGQVIRREAGLTAIDAKAIGVIIADEVKVAVKDGINELIKDQRISQEFENSRSA